jgi:magnesium transporter
VVDATGRLLGTLTPPELLALPDGQPIGPAAHRHRVHVPAGTDQEHMASIALHHGATSMPVVDNAGRLVGVVGAAALMQILRREHVEDLHRLAGIARESAQATEALQSPPLRRLRHRLPWVLAGLAGSAAATLLVSRFETALAAKPALAFFVPGLVYLADAIGTQSETIAVRGLSLSHLGLRNLFAAEMRTGLLMGLVLASLAWPLVWAVFRDPRLATTVALALGMASMLASSLGLVFPALLQRMGADPAYGSGPLATIMQDVLSLAIYFGCVSLIMF